MELSKTELLERTLAKEKAAREQAEKTLNEKTSTFTHLSQELQKENTRLKNLLDKKALELKGVFSTILDAHIVMDIEGNVLKMNHAATKLLGYTLKDKPFNLLQLLAEEYRDYTFEAFGDLYKTGAYKNYQAVIITKNKERKRIQVNASLIYDHEGKPIAAQGIARDITRETQMKALLEEQKKQLNIIVENSPIGIALSDRKSKGLLLVNKAFCTMLEYEHDELKSLQIKDFTHPDDMAATVVKMQEIQKGEIDHFFLEKRYFTKSGKIIWAKTSVTAVREDSGEIKYQIATIEDITPQKKASNALEESNNRLSTLILNLQSGILLEDENGKIVLTNKQFCKQFGLEENSNALIGYDFAALAKKLIDKFENNQNIISRVETIISEKKRVLGEEIELKDGKILERNFIPIFQEDSYKGHLWSYEDITLKKKYKENLQAQKEKYSRMITNMNLGLVELDTEEVVLFANQSFCDITGYSLDELQGKKARDFLVTDPTYQSPSTRLTGSWELKITTKNKKQKYLLVTRTENYDVNKNLIGYIGITLDITVQKNLELQKESLLKNLEKQNEQLNEYAHIVSHDLKSPLHSISALISWTKEDFSEHMKKESLVNLELIEGKVEKMNLLIENILKYSSIDKDNIQNAPIDLNSLVEDALGMIFIPENIQVSVLNTLPIINADATRIQQLFQNLLSNAVNHIEQPKGLVEIDYIEKENHFLFSIQDNGIGIKKEYYKKIFTIFNSLGNNEKSTGIGLSIVKKVVDLYEGDIWLESEVGKGTTFFFTLKK
ncbi:MAG TPA: PAS domain S-box protein [Leeuwenhoekiella sp.]|nr:PAS domain S-box protein [Leeuwenhoekiella sp.]